MHNIYYSPEKFGLEMVGGVELSDGNYQFDTIILLRDSHGILLYAHDSGCSCPSPFEDTGVDDLTPCTISEFKTYAETEIERKADWYGNDETSRMRGELVDLLIRVKSLS